MRAGPLLFLGDMARSKKAAGVGYTRYDTADDVEEYLCSSLQELESHPFWCLAISRLTALIFSTQPIGDCVFESGEMAAETA